jgi:hypothetical protein
MILFPFSLREKVGMRGVQFIFPHPTLSLKERVKKC